MLMYLYPNNLKLLVVRGCEKPLKPRWCLSFWNLQSFQTLPFLKTFLSPGKKSIFNLFGPKPYLNCVHIAEKAPGCSSSRLSVQFWQKKVDLPGQNPFNTPRCPDSSVGRAADWKSACRWFDSASGHHKFYGALIPLCNQSTTVFALLNIAALAQLVEQLPCNQ